VRPKKKGGWVGIVPITWADDEPIVELCFDGRSYKPTWRYEKKNGTVTQVKIPRKKD